MSLQIPAVINGKNQTFEVSEKVFGQEFNETLIHQLVVAYLAGGRSGTKSQKTRAEVSGGGAKPWRQKGSGRARAGTIRSPLWRKGGVTFAAAPRSYKQKLNKKMYRAGMRSILSELLRQDRLLVSDDIYPSVPKTKELTSKLNALGIKKGLLITGEMNEYLHLAARNLNDVELFTASALNPVSLVNSEKVVLTTQAVRHLEDHLG